jgi:hypothetical protein
MNIKLLLGNLKGRDHSEDIGVDRRIILQGVLGKQRGRVCTGFTRLWVEAGSSLL